MSAERIARVDAVEVTLPLPQPLVLGPLRIAERTYAVVAVTTDGGLTGHAISLSRGAPVAACVREMLAPVLAGADALRTDAAWEAMYRSTIAAGRTGLVMRAISLVDIALWDIKGKRAGLPVHLLLGGAHDDVEAMLVGGYPRAGLDAEALGERAGAYAGEGYRLIKVARNPDPAFTATVLRTAARGLRRDGALVVDAAWAWDAPEDALREVRHWHGDAPIAWLEDPLAPESTEACARLARLCPVPLGFGDDVADEHVLRRLVQAEALRVLRIDATSVGGITVAARLAAHAHHVGLPVSYHVYPEIHVHLAAGLPGRGLVETFDPADNPFDPCAELLTGALAFRAGRVAPPEAPGLGFEVDAERVAHARRTGDDG